MLLQKPNSEQIHCRNSEWYYVYCIVTDRPQSMGLYQKFRNDEHTFGAGFFDTCKLVSVRIRQNS